MPEFRITIGSKTNRSQLPGGRPRKLEVLKAAIVGLLGLGIVIGILLAALVVGSIVASLLLVLLAVVFIIAVVRYLLRNVKSRLKFQGK
jgi:uncharacterized membrane protein YfcA